MRRMLFDKMRNEIEQLYVTIFNIKNENYLDQIERTFTRDGLDLRKRLLSAVSTLTVMGLNQHLRYFIEWALMENVPAQEIYEVILQSYLFAGYPTAIESLFVLRDVLHKKGMSLKDEDSNYRVNEWRERGLELCRQVYGNNFDQLQKNMREISPELEEWMIVEGYGKVLSRPQLGAVERELCTVAALTAMGKERQLLSHIRGALNVGAEEDEVREAILQTSLFAGLPATLKGLEVFRQC